MPAINSSYKAIVIIVCYQMWLVAAFIACWLNNGIWILDVKKQENNQLYIWLSVICKLR